MYAFGHNMKLKRRHLIEIHDQSWCPHAIRNNVRGMIRLVCVTAPVYRSITPKLFSAVKQSTKKQVVDLCSGVGGPWEQLIQSSSARQAQIEKATLTDLFPHPEAYARIGKNTQGNIEYSDQAVDATNVPEHFNGFRTLFASFHHFQPELAQGILDDAVKKQEGIGIFEMTDRSWTAVIGIFLSSLISPFILVPFIRPFSWKALFWTYIIPATSIVAAIDGAVSCLRTYSPQEMIELVENLNESDYLWDIGKIREPYSPFVISYLIGYPKPA